MKFSVFTSIILSLVLFTDWINVIYPKFTVSASAAPPANTCTLIGRIISIRGRLQLKRQDWSGYRSTTIGATLCLGDLLKPEKGTKVVVRCVAPDQNLWTVPEGIVSGAASGCRPPDKPIHTINGPIVPTRNPSSRRIPYIISPSRTLLLNNKPKLRWQAVPNATRYTVRVSGPGVAWETEVSATSVSYPGNPPLEPQEVGYLVTVEADTGEAPAKATFGMLDQKQAQFVRSTIDQINKQDLTEEAKTLALADFYVGQELIAEAIGLLESTIAKGNKTAAIHYLLGDLYSSLELFHKAETNYLKTIELTITEEGLELNAAAATRLGEVYNALGNSEAASKWLEQAKTKYKALEATQQTRT